MLSGIEIFNFFLFLTTLSHAFALLRNVRVALLFPAHTSIMDQLQASDTSKETSTIQTEFAGIKLKLTK